MLALLPPHGTGVAAAAARTAVPRDGSSSTTLWGACCTPAPRDGSDIWYGGCVDNLHTLPRPYGTTSYSVVWDNASTSTSPGIDEFQSMGL